MRRLRIAIIGAGHLGRIHTRLLKPVDEVELVGVVDPIPEARARLAAEYDIPAFSDQEELPAGLDGAIVATTTAQHYHVGSALLRRGVHLFIEKPISSTVAEADELVGLAKSKRLVLQVGHVERFNPAWRAVAARVRRPRYIEAVRMSGYTFRSTDIGVVLDLMIHDLDLVLSTVRSDVIEIDAIGSTVFGPHEDMAHAHLRFANGCIANLNVSRTSFYSQRTMQIVTDRVYGSVDFADFSARIVRPSKQVLRGEIDVQAMTIDERERVKHNLFTDMLPVSDLVVEKRNAIQDEQSDFLNCIRSGRRPRVCGEQGRYCLSVAEKVLDRIRATEDLASRIPSRLRVANRARNTVPAREQQPATEERRAG